MTYKDASQARSSSARAGYQSAIAKEWVKRQHPDIWEKICNMALKKYPSRGENRRSTTEASIAASKLLTNGDGEAA